MLLEQMADGLHLPPQFVERVAHSADHSYKSYSIRKRSGGHRQIDHPSRPLKALQRWLLSHVVDRFPVHASAYAYRRNTGIGEHATKHSGSRFLLRMDIEDFFPSLTSSHLRVFMNSTAVQAVTGPWTQADRDVFVALVCRRGRLTIGAPTSPALSNALFREVDCALASLAESGSLTYTRYADDLFFSSVQAGVLGAAEVDIKATVEQASFPSGLRINAAKTRHSSKKGRRRVTGITLSSDGSISLGRGWKRVVRSMIYRFAELSDDERLRLAGMLAYGKSIEPDLINRLVLKYGHLAVRQAMGRATPNSGP